jgi:hypothetical protein
MRFLLRMAFWLGVILVLLPSGGGTKPSTNAPQFDAADAVTVAGAAIADMRHFCERQPEACAAGGQAAVLIGQRAQAGAKMLYELLSERMSQADTSAVTGSAERAAARPMPRSQNTLKPADLEPAWRGPPPRKERPA